MALSEYDQYYSNGNGVKIKGSINMTNPIEIKSERVPDLVPEDKKFLELIKYLDPMGYTIFYKDKIFILNNMDYTMHNCITYAIDVDFSFFPDPAYRGDSGMIIFENKHLMEIKKQKLPIHLTWEPGWVNLIAGDLYRMSVTDPRIKTYIHAICRTTIEMDDMYSDPICNNSSYTEEDLKANEQFARILQFKAANGAALVTLNEKYDMFLYPGLFPINKPDKVSVDIYEVDNISFLTKFTIKKKLFSIRMYIRFAYMRR